LTRSAPSSRLWTGWISQLTGKEASYEHEQYAELGGPGIGHRIEEAVELIEMELRHAIAYVNDAVIPQVRRESISAMRTAADTLRTLADRF